MQDQKLAKAMLDMFGWKVGMVDEYGDVIVSVNPTKTSKLNYDNYFRFSATYALQPNDINPCLKSKANWGHWHAAVDDMLGGANLKRSGPFWVAETECGSVWSAEYYTPPPAFLELLCRASGPIHKQDNWPPSVLEWYLAIKEEDDE